jgi:hypothetical protein
MTATAAETAKNDIQRLLSQGMTMMGATSVPDQAKHFTTATPVLNLQLDLTLWHNQIYVISCDFMS